MVADINPNGDSNPAGLVAVGTTVYFVADDGRHGRELWRTSAGSDTTRLVADVRRGRASSHPTVLAAVGSIVYFAAADGVRGLELWRTDGTSAGTLLVKDITAGVHGTEFGRAAGIGNKLFFGANAHLWVTDGTSAGTRRIGPLATNLVPFRGRMYFLSGQHPYDHRIWTSDGTARGTAQVGWSPVEVNEITATGTELFMLSGFQTPMQKTLPTLWRSSGTKASTVRLTASYALDQAYGLTTAGNDVFFFDENYDSDGTAELWHSDGTRSGTRRLAVVPMPLGPATAVGSSVVFSVNIGGANWQLWRSDGSATSTRALETFSGGSEPSEVTVVGPRVSFYTYNYDEDVWRLWVTDASAPGASISVAMGSPASAHPFHLTAAQSRLYFSLDDGVHGSELWSYTP
jgi:ELWxxDGT repeat protein